MATINVQGESIEVTTSGYSTPDYYIIVHFSNSDTEEGYLTQAEIGLTHAKSRSDCTFDDVQERIDEYFEENGIEVDELSSVRVVEKEAIKSGWN